MDVLHSRCAAIDVHKKLLKVCFRLSTPEGIQKETVEYGTMTRDILRLSDALLERGVTHVVMESTGSYWRPVYNLLEGSFALTLANAQHVKNVPGRKTDVKDAEWLADLHAHGLISSSFVPDQEQRALRDLTRTRSTLVAERARLSNRIQKTLEDANVKLASVVSDVLGVSSRKMLRALISGAYEPRSVAGYAKGVMKKKIPDLELALDGRVKEHHRIILRTLLSQVDSLTESIEELSQSIAEAMGQAKDPFEEAVALLDSAPGVARLAAEGVVAEIGTQMDRFHDAAHLASWSGLCPGNHQSAGKRLSGRITPGNQSLKPLMIQIAQAAARQKGTYCQELYRRIAARRGKKRALVAVAHSLIVAFYHMLKNGEPYRDLGPDHFAKRDSKRTLRRLTDQLERLGYAAVPVEAAA